MSSPHIVCFLILDFAHYKGVYCKNILVLVFLVNFIVVNVQIYILKQYIIIPLLTPTYI